MDRMIPFIRLGQLTLNLEDAKNESENKTEEKIKGYRLRINELDAMNQQLKALNQQISSEYSAASASNDILLPFLLKPGSYCHYKNIGWQNHRRK